MGGICSSGRSIVKENPYSSRNANFEPCKSVSESQPHMQQTTLKQTQEKEIIEPKLSRDPSIGSRQTSKNGSNAAADDFYDGIPRYQMQKSRSTRSIAKVSEVSSRLGRGAKEVFDTLGSSVSNLNPGAGFASGVATRGSELEILSFEVANTVVKGSNLMQSLSNKSIKHLKEVVLPSEGVQRLISKDLDELLITVAADKREELKIFSGEVVRFGNRCKDPQWHNLDRYFEKISRELTPQKQLKEEAETVMQQLMNMVQYTAELYHQLHSLDRIEQDYQRKRLENEISTAHRGDGLSILKSDLKSQKKQVKTLKKKSLWSRSLEEVMEKLVDIVHFLLLEIHTIFGVADAHAPSKISNPSNPRLGPAGLSLHYANVVIQIDTLVARSSSLPQSMKDTLYQSLPPNVKSALRSKLQSFVIKEELSVEEIKAEMEKTLQWLVPMATNTAKAHHGFGWVGEWASTGSDSNRKPMPLDVVRIETFHHANKDRTEIYILEQLLWLHHLVSKSKTSADNAKSPIRTPKKSPQTALTVEDKGVLRELLQKKTRAPGISKSHDFDHMKIRLRRDDRLSKSSSYSPMKENQEIVRVSSAVTAIDFGVSKEKALDAIDGVGNVM